MKHKLFKIIVIVVTVLILFAGITVGYLLWQKYQNIKNADYNTNKAMSLSLEQLNQDLKSKAGHDINFFNNNINKVKFVNGEQARFVGYALAVNNFNKSSLEAYTVAEQRLAPSEVDTSFYLEFIRVANRANDVKLKESLKEKAFSKIQQLSLPDAEKETQKQLINRAVDNG